MLDLPAYHILNAMVIFYTVHCCLSEVSDLLLSKITWDNNYPKGDDFIRTFVACFSWVHLESLGVNLNLKKS